MSMTIDPQLFKQYDIRGVIGENGLHADVYRAVGRAFADFLPSAGPVVVGHDMRPSSVEFAAALCEGLQMQGRDVRFIGMVPSDVVFYATAKHNYAGGAMVTASHNPGEYNGCKLVADHAMTVGLPNGLGEIRDKAIAGNFTVAETPGTCTDEPITEEWIEHVMSFIDVEACKPFNIVADCGNGMVGALMPAIEERLPITVERLFYEPDGNFPNHEANPKKAETLTEAAKLITDKQLDFGIAFDGDGDRVGLIDGKGRVLTGSMLVAFLSQFCFADSDNPPTIVHDLLLGHSARDFFAANGATTKIVPVGNPFIKHAMHNDGAEFGGEVSGHIMFGQNFNFDSGLVAAIVAIHLLSQSDETLTEFVDRVETRQQIDELNIRVTDTEAALKAMREHFSQENLDELDGITATFTSGNWCNARASNTEPVLRLNAEAHTQEALDEIVSELKLVLAPYVRND